MSRTFSRRLWRVALLACVLPSLVCGPGCTRAFYRKWADKEALEVLGEKSKDPRWNLDHFSPLPDSRARFADDTRPDRPPMPPDDPAARALSPNPQKPGKAGIARVEGTGYLALLDCWDRENRGELAAREAERKRQEKARKRPQASPADKIPYEESFRQAEEQVQRVLADPVTNEGAVPEAEAKAARSQERTYLLKLDQAVELGVINSREYQTRREQLFLAALPVTLERFAFAPQLFAFGTYVRERIGAGFPGGPVDRSRFDSNLGVTKLFSTGGLLLLRFANRTIINIGTSPTTSVSTLSLDLVQPLLQGAGRAVTLEPLTQAERNLLYAIRDFARFRQEFYVFVAAGQPSFIPGVQAGVQAITPGTVSTPGVFIPGAPVVSTGPLGLTDRPRVRPGDAVNFRSAIGPGGATPQGFISTLGEKAQLINQYRNAAAFRRYLRLFQVYLEGGIVNSVQVGQVEQTLLRTTDNLLSDQANYRNSVDQLKQQLGLPMNIRLDVSDDILRPVYDVTRRFEELSDEYERISGLAANLAVPGDEANLRGRLRRLLTEEPYVAQTSFPKRLRQRWAEWEKLPSRARPGERTLLEWLKRLTDQRRKLEARRELLSDRGEQLSKEEAARLTVLEFEVELGRFELALRNYESKPWEGEKDEARRASQRLVRFGVVYRQFLALLEEPFQERREKVRQTWPSLPPVCVDGVDLLRAPDDVVETVLTRAALNNRLDLMNQRAQLVDSWRKIAVAANSLMGVVDVQYHGELTTPQGAAEPLNFGYNRYRHQAAVAWELPIVRIAERNAYRSALIAYQQQRRALQQAEDNVLFAVRLELRQLRAAVNNDHRVQKRNVELAYTQVDQALQAFSQPQAPAGGTPPGLVGPPAASGGGGDPAALTQQLVNSQNSLLQAVNGLYNTYLNVITTRMALYRDLGIMPLDPRGAWIDDTANCCPPQRAAGPATDELPTPRSHEPPPGGGGRDEPARPGAHPDGRPGGGDGGAGGDGGGAVLGAGYRRPGGDSQGPLRGAAGDDHRAGFLRIRREP